MKLRPRYLAVFCVAMSVAGCGTLSGPAYERPETPDKAQWSQLDGRTLTTSEVIQPDWWTNFGDPELNGLIDRAIAEGLDVEIAALRLDKAGVQLGKDRTSVRPELSPQPTDSIARRKENNQSSTTARETEVFGLSLSWELDIWGKIRKELQAADARYRASEMDWRATQLSLAASVAERYFQIRQFDEQIAQQKASKAQAETMLTIYEAQHGEGMIPESRLRQQRAEIASLSSRMIDLERGRNEAQLKLATLLGVPAGALTVPVAGLRERVRLPETPQVLPTDMLARRPDVLKAEYNVLAAHHALGKARLARLPTFSLTGVAKTGTSFASTFINSWTFGLGASWAGLFDRDLKIDVELNEVDVKIAKEEYRRAVLQAFEEVEVALLNLSARQEQMRELQKQIDDLRVVKGVQDARLSEGLVSQLEVFETERSLLGAQQEVLTLHQQLLTDTVTLYKALGGGWPPEAVGKQPSAVVSSHVD